MYLCDLNYIHMHKKKAFESIKGPMGQFPFPKCYTLEKFNLEKLEIIDGLNFRF